MINVTFRDVLPMEPLLQHAKRSYAELQREGLLPGGSSLNLTVSRVPEGTQHAVTWQLERPGLPTLRDRSQHASLELAVSDALRWLQRSVRAPAERSWLECSTIREIAR